MACLLLIDLTFFRCEYHLLIGAKKFSKQGDLLSHGEARITTFPLKHLHRSFKFENEVFSPVIIRFLILTPKEIESTLKALAATKELV
jgi:hypothetical protein